MSRRIAVLISGRGSNLQSIIDAVRSRTVDATLAVVVSNRADAAGLLRAKEAGLETVFLDPKVHASRDDYDRALADLLQSRGVEFTSDLLEFEWGHVARFQDPDGNRLQIREGR